jgi:hypothetical protein
MPSERVSPELQAEIIRRANGCCEYCQSQSRFATQSFSVEHVVPRSKGGATESENLALSCQGCNNHKYTKTQALDAIGGNVVPLFHPRRDSWGDHFAWSGDCTLTVGMTPTGRATVEALQLNRVGLMNLRRVLYDAGEHPPPRRDTPPG